MKPKTKPRPPDPRIRFAPEILRRLGEELNPSPSQGILELVKNAYDADATRCVVTLEDTENAGGTIVVQDNGIGMTESDILNGWLVLGKSAKEDAKKTGLGRTPAGNKGLGRLAALRLGTEATLQTHPIRSPRSSYSITIDWNRFDDVDVVDDVLLDLTRSTRPQGHEGTKVVLSNLRSRIQRSEVKRIARALVLLADPFTDDPASFVPSLDAPEFRDLEKLVKGRYFDDADYHLIAKVDSSGKATARVVDWRGLTLFEGTHADIATSSSGDGYLCSSATFELWAYILSKSAFVGRNSTVGEVQKWLREFGGVHLYEEGLRVTPYGNPGNDWLDMNLARTRSPEERPSTNTSIGRVQIASGNALLVQKTDRSGFIETDAFRSLRVFCQDALSWMQRERLSVAEARRVQQRSEAPSASAQQRTKVESALAKVPPDIRHEVEVAFRVYDKTREREIGQLQSEVQLYRTLSTAGITAAVFAHEADGNPLKVIKTATSTLRRRAHRLAARDKQQFIDPLATIDVATAALEVLGSTTLGLVERGKRRSGRVDIHSTIRRIVASFDPFLSARGVSITVDTFDGQPYLKATEAAIESVVTNLLNNSLTAFDSAHTRDRRIVLRTTHHDGTVTLVASDSGPGISGIKISSIWLPGETTRENGTGLGLTIVRDTIRDLGGEVRAIAVGELGGAEFAIDFPVIGV